MNLTGYNAYKIIIIKLSTVSFCLGVTPFFEFYQGKNGSKKKLCTFYIHVPDKFNKKEMTDYGCPNDKAKSMKVCYAREGTNITVYDDPEYREGKDDWTTIIVNHDMGNDRCETISDFETDKDYEFLEVDYKTTGNLNGKVSSFTILQGIIFLLFKTK